MIDSGVLPPDGSEAKAVAIQRKARIRRALRRIQAVPAAKGELNAADRFLSGVTGELEVVERFLPEVREALDAAERLPKEVTQELEAAELLLRDMAVEFKEDKQAGKLIVEDRTSALSNANLQVRSAFIDLLEAVAFSLKRGEALDHDLARWLLGGVNQARESIEGLDVPYVRGAESDEDEDEEDKYKPPGGRPNLDLALGWSEQPWRPPDRATSKKALRNAARIEMKRREKLAEILEGFPAKKWSNLKDLENRDPAAAERAADRIKAKALREALKWAVDFSGMPGCSKTLAREYQEFKFRLTITPVSDLEIFARPPVRRKGGKPGSSGSTK